MFDQYEWQGWAFENLREVNNFADVTLAYEDGQQVEAHRVILAGQVLFNKLFLSHYQININNIAAGKRLQQQVSQCSAATCSPTQVRVYQLPVGVDGLASLA